MKIVEKERQEAPHVETASHNLKPWIALACLICAGAITTAILKRYRHIPHPPVAASSVIAGAAGLTALGLIYRSRRQPQVTITHTTTHDEPISASDTVPVEDTLDDAELRNHLRSQYPELERSNPNWMMGSWGDVRGSLSAMMVLSSVSTAASGALALINQHRPQGMFEPRPMTGAQTERGEAAALESEPADEPTELSPFQAAVVHMKAMVNRCGVPDYIWNAQSENQLRDALEDAIMMELKPVPLWKMGEALEYLNQQFPYNPRECAIASARALAAMGGKVITINAQASDPVVFNQMLRVASMDTGWADVWGLSKHQAGIAIVTARQGVRHMIRVLPEAAKAVEECGGTLNYKGWIAHLRHAGVLPSATASQ